MTTAMRLLLISNSTNAGEEYLKYPIGEIGRFLKGVKAVRFIPYAGVTFSHQAYEEKVQKRFDEIGVKVESIHRFADARKAIEEAEAIVVGGGNTWRLLQLMQQQHIIDLIHKRVAEGLPYVGWSAGSNVACPTISTTNDMPIVQPDGFKAFNLVPFQINPHYLDANPEGHAGETREDRIMEYIEVNRSLYVVGLREGSILHIENGTINLIGKKPARIFHHGMPIREVQPGEDLSFLFN